MVIVVFVSEFELIWLSQLLQEKETDSLSLGHHLHAFVTVDFSTFWMQNNGPHQCFTITYDMFDFISLVH